MAEKITAIIQARIGSKRLPGKILATILDKTLVEHVIQRVKASRLIDDLIVATTEEDRDEVVANLAQRLGVKCFRGSEADVLDRTYQAAKHFGAAHIVRVTGDCPLVDPLVIDRVVEAYQVGEYDFVTNTLLFPDGQDVEVFSFKALELAWANAGAASDREHVTGYIQNSGEFRVYEVKNDKDLSWHKWSVDTEQDLEFVRSIFEKLRNKGEIFHLDDVLQVLQDYPELGSQDGAGVRDEGYYRSIANDPPVVPHELPLSRSSELKQTAEKLIPSGSQTFSKGPTQLVQGAAPVYLERGQGSHVWDVDGNEYIDYPLGLGPVR